MENEIKHGFWTEGHTCSVCGAKAPKAGVYDGVLCYFHPDNCPSCGVTMDTGKVPANPPKKK